MSTLVLALKRRAAWLARVGDFVELTKPGISVMILVTVAVACYLGSGPQTESWAVVHCVLGTLLVSASASALNQWLERRTDARMPRTSRRPLPGGRLAGWQVVGFAVVTVVAGELYLLAAVGARTALLALVTWILYAWIYTPLKTKSHWNTAVGAVSGALPILIGWSASGATFDLRVDPRSAVLFLILFFWQFPHFMAIAWIYRKQYAAAGLQMLTVVDGSGRRAARQAIVTAILVLIVSLTPLASLEGALVSSWGGIIYLLVALALGLVQLGCAIKFAVCRDDLSARKLLRASLIYLPGLMACLLFLPLH